MIRGSRNQSGKRQAAMIVRSLGLRMVYVIDVSQKPNRPRRRIERPTLPARRHNQSHPRLIFGGRLPPRSTNRIFAAPHGSSTTRGDGMPAFIMTVAPSAACVQKMDWIFPLGRKPRSKSTPCHLDWEALQSNASPR